MLSIEKCKQILKQNNYNYTEEEIKIIRDYLYKVANLNLINFKSQSDEKSSNILPSQYN